MKKTVQRPFPFRRFHFTFSDINVVVLPYVIGQIHEMIYITTLGYNPSTVPLPVVVIDRLYRPRLFVRSTGKFRFVWM